jgi:dihydrofolate synthase / folylpolyglutamate synthase
LLDRLLALETTGIRLGLENITRLCAALGNPERSFTCLHVAGTNGKGSVTAMVHAALLAGGVRAARFTSPHLVDVTERFVIGSTPVSVEELDDAANFVLDRADSPPTFFEATTAIAFELFRRARVDVAVIEVGLGGRFDSTNVIVPPVGAITSIGLDHQDYLGDTLEAIALEKAGIIKPGMTVIVGAMPDTARRVIDEVAAAERAVVIDAKTGAHVQGGMQDGRATLVIDTPEDRYGPMTLALRGEHQTGNALVAVRLLEAVRRSGVWLPGEAIERGLTGVEWPARLELIDLPDGGQVLLDAAHNVDGAKALAAYLRRWYPARLPLVIGTMRDKDVEGMIDSLLPVVSSITATAAATPRAMLPAELADRVRSRLTVPAGDAAQEIRVEPDPMAAVEQALSRSRIVCVAGSIFLAGAVREALKRRAILR